jgi:hypothetical protein
VTLVDASDFRKMAEQILNELTSLEIQQEETEHRIARLKQVLVDLAPLSQESIPSVVDVTTVHAEKDRVSITDATRRIFQDAQGPLEPSDIKQLLLNMGIDLGDHKNVMAGIHSLLKRLVAGGEIETRDNGLTYKWKGFRVVLSSPEPRPSYVDPRKLRRNE